MTSLVEKSIKIAVASALLLTCLADFPDDVPSEAHYGPDQSGFRLGIYVVGLGGVPRGFERNQLALVFLTSSIVPAGIDKAAFYRNVATSFELVDANEHRIPVRVDLCYQNRSDALGYKWVYPKAVPSNSSAFLGAYKLFRRDRHPLRPGRYLIRLRMLVPFTDGNSVELISGEWEYDIVYSPSQLPGLSHPRSD